MVVRQAETHAPPCSTVKSSQKKTLSLQFCNNGEKAVMRKGGTVVIKRITPVPEAEDVNLYAE
jgi:hypothetical protein